jgi:hypothetical protein
MFFAAGFSGGTPPNDNPNAQIKFSINESTPPRDKIKHIVGNTEDLRARGRGKSPRPAQFGLQSRRLWQEYAAYEIHQSDIGGVCRFGVSPVRLQFR